MHRIGVIGRLTLDLLFTGLPRLPEPGEEVRSDAFTVSLGGGMAALYPLLRRMNTPVELGTFLDDSFEAELTVRLLDALGCTGYVNLYRGGGRPVTVSAVLSLAGDRSFVSREEALRLPATDETAAFFEGCDIALIPPDASLAKLLRARGTRVAFDPSDANTAETRALLPHLDLCTPNLREARAITGCTEPEDALQALAAAGARCPVVKLGDAGCLLLDSGCVRHIPAPEGMRIVDTTGAGDHFLAGMLYGLARDWQVADCARMGCVCGSLSTRAPGVFGAAYTEAEALAVYSREERAGR